MKTRGQNSELYAAGSLPEKGLDPKKKRLEDEEPFHPQHAPQMGYAKPRATEDLAQSDCRALGNT